jgi:hypothetical protein
MAGLNEWSATPGSNASVGSVNWTEGQNASTVNNSARQMMADVADVVQGTGAVYDTWTFCDPADTTKKFRFDGGSVSAGATIVVTIPNADLSFSTFATTILDDTSAGAARSTLGLAIGTDVQAYDADLAAISGLTQTRGNVPQSNGTTFVASAALLPDNLLYNPCFEIASRGTSFASTTTPANNDDTWLLDRWLLLSDGNDIADISKETTTIPTTGALAACKVDIETANKKLALVQILTQEDSAAVIGGVASLAFEARIGGSNATLGTMRAYVASWAGTADSVTSDLISTWPAAGVDPTLAANWTLENAGSDLTLTTSYQDFRVENVSIDTSGAKNVAVILMIDDADATVGDLLYISKARLVPGAVATPLKRRADEKERCWKFCQPFDTNGTAVVGGNLGSASSTTVAKISIGLKPTMRAAPTLTLKAAASNFAVTDQVSGTALTALALNDSHTGGALLNATVASGLTQFRPYFLYTSGAQGFYFDAEM